MAFITIPVTPAEANAIRGSEDLASLTELTGAEATFHKNNPVHVLERFDREISLRTARGRPCEPLQSVRRKVVERSPA